jgi:hypothetical protein
MKQNTQNVNAESKPVCKLTGKDGNVFAVIGRVSSTLKRAGQNNKAKEFENRAIAAGSYEEVLAMVLEYVDVK